MRRAVIVSDVRVSICAVHQIYTGSTNGEKMGAKTSNARFSSLVKQNA